MSSPTISAPTTFLSLAPTTSASYPVRKPSVTKSSPLDTDVAEALKTRRSSSLGSDASATKRRFLKLGPVHWGEGDGLGDWSEDVLAE